MRPETSHWDVFRAIADPTRRAMIELLRSRDRSATELATPFSISRPAASQHLGVLLEAGIVDVRAEGRLRIYHLKPEGLDRVLDWAGALGSRQALRVS